MSSKRWLCWLYSIMDLKLWSTPWFWPSSFSPTSSCSSISRMRASPTSSTRMYSRCKYSRIQFQIWVWWAISIWARKVVGCFPLLMRWDLALFKRARPCVSLDSPIPSTLRTSKPTAMRAPSPCWSKHILTTSVTRGRQLCEEVSLVSKASNLIVSIRDLSMAARVRLSDEEDRC